MSQISKYLADSEATKALGQSLAQSLAIRPCLILLFGDLGAGKTSLTTAFLKALLGANEAIQSPTYSYMNHYQSSIPIYHFDLYRIEAEEELFELGLLEYLTNTNALRIVEWPEKAPFLLDMADIIIRLENDKGGRLAKISTSIEGIA